MGTRGRLLIALVTFAAAGCGAGNNPSAELDKSIVLGEPHMNIENGSAFDKATVDITKYKTLVLPESARLDRSGDSGTMQIYMKKTLDFGGKIPDGMSIRTERKNMGCAFLNCFIHNGTNRAQFEATASPSTNGNVLCPNSRFLSFR